jgi:hypothetical protein
MPILVKSEISISSMSYKAYQRSRNALLKKSTKKITKRTFSCPHGSFKLVDFKHNHISKKDTTTHKITQHWRYSYYNNTRKEYINRIKNERIYYEKKKKIKKIGLICTRVNCFQQKVSDNKPNNLDEWTECELWKKYITDKPTKLSFRIIKNIQWMKKKEENPKP